MAIHLQNPAVSVTHTNTSGQYTLPASHLQHVYHNQLLGGTVTNANYYAYDVHLIVTDRYPHHPLKPHYLIHIAPRYTLNTVNPYTTPFSTTTSAITNPFPNAINTTTHLPWPAPMPTTTTYDESEANVPDTARLIPVHFLLSFVETSDLPAHAHHYATRFVSAGVTRSVAIEHTLELASDAYFNGAAYRYGQEDWAEFDFDGQNVRATRIPKGTTVTLRLRVTINHPLDGREVPL